IRARDSSLGDGCRKLDIESADVSLVQCPVGRGAPESPLTRRRSAATLSQSRARVGRNTLPASGGGWPRSGRVRGSSSPCSSFTVGKHYFAKHLTRIHSPRLAAKLHPLPSNLRREGLYEGIMVLIPEGS